MYDCEIADGRIYVRTPFAEKERAQGLPGARWCPKRRRWHYPATPAAAENLRATWPELAIPPELSGPALVRRLALRDAREGRYAGYKIRTEPWRHQMTATTLALTTDAALLHMGMGTGKTKVILDAAVNGPWRRVLVICPKTVIDVWAREARKHAPCVRAIPLQKGSVARRAETLAMWAGAPGSEPRLFVVNYEAAWRGALAKALQAVTWDALVLDESQKIKSPGSKVSRFCADHLRAERRFALTGTPLHHTPLDAYGQYRALDAGVFGTSFAKFRDRYAVMGGFEGHQVLGYRNQDELRVRMDMLRFEVGREVLDLPPILFDERTCDLEPGARRLYDEMEAEFVAETNEGTITAGNALAKLLRLQQIASGTTRTAEGVDVVVSLAKQEALAEMLEEMNGEPVVVFCRFHGDLDAVQLAAETCGVESRELSGRRNELADWTGGVLAVQMQAGGVGIDLTLARYAIWYSLGFSLGDYNQCVARLHRPGQDRPVTVYHLIARGTVDRRILRAVRRNQEIVDAVLGSYRQGGEATDDGKSG